MKYLSWVITFKDQNGKEQTIESQMMQTFEQLLQVKPQIEAQVGEITALKVKEYELKEIGVYEIIEQNEDISGSI